MWQILQVARNSHSTIVGRNSQFHATSFCCPICSPCIELGPSRPQRPPARSIREASGVFSFRHVSSIYRECYHALHDTRLAQAEPETKATAQSCCVGYVAGVVRRWFSILRTMLFMEPLCLSALALQSRRLRAVRLSFALDFST